MSVESALAAGRAAHAQLFVDACTITRVTGHTLDPATNVYTDTVVTIYTGPCRLRQPTTDPSLAEAGEQAITVRRYWLDLPWNAPAAVAVHDIAALTASDDAWAIGRPLTLVGIGLSGSSTKRRLTVEDRT
jgi:hypothetical protein